MDVYFSRRVAMLWREDGAPADWHLIEQGAHDGTLMADLLSELRNIEPDLAATLRVHFIEPAPALATRQRETLAARVPQGKRIHWHASAAALARTPLNGLLLANELIDALPFSRVRWIDGQWGRLNVGCSQREDGPAFFWLAGAAMASNDPDAPRVAEPAQLPEGYTTEIFPCYAGFARDTAAIFCGYSGHLLLLDYGFFEADYYHPSRTDGTLRCYLRHRATDDPFSAIGDSDITAHVNWDALCRALGSENFICTPLQPQGSWLVRLAEPWLREIETAGPPDTATRALLRQFQTLTHPGSMGARFQVLEATLPPC